MVLTDLTTGVLIGVAVGIVLACLVLAGAWRAAASPVLSVHETRDEEEPAQPVFADKQAYLDWQATSGRTLMHWEMDAPGKAGYQAGKAGYQE